MVLPLLCTTLYLSILGTGEILRDVPYPKAFSNNRNTWSCSMEFAKLFRDFWHLLCRVLQANKVRMTIERRSWSRLTTSPNLMMAFLILCSRVSYTSRPSRSSSSNGKKLAKGSFEVDTDYFLTPIISSPTSSTTVVSVMTHGVDLLMALFMSKRGFRHQPSKK